MSVCVKNPKMFTFGATATFLVPTIHFRLEVRNLSRLFVGLVPCSDPVVTWVRPIFRRNNALLRGCTRCCWDVHSEWTISFGQCFWNKEFLVVFVQKRIPEPKTKRAYVTGKVCLTYSSSNTKSPVTLLFLAAQNLSQSTRVFRTVSCSHHLNYAPLKSPFEQTQKDHPLCKKRLTFRWVVSFRATKLIRVWVRDANSAWSFWRIGFPSKTVEEIYSRFCACVKMQMTWLMA